MNVDVVTRFKAVPVSAPKHEARLRAFGCLVPGCLQKTIHLHHALTKGAHGDLPQNLVPLCFLHHRAFHDKGRHTFKRLYGIDLEVAAAWLAFHSRMLGILK